MPIRSLAELQLDELIRNKKFTPSPAAWDDEVLYFLLVDRFSDAGRRVTATSTAMSSIPAQPSFSGAATR